MMKMVIAASVKRNFTSMSATTGLYRYKTQFIGEFRFKSLSAIDTTIYPLDNPPVLNRVRSLPFLGSLIPAYSNGAPRIDLNRNHEWLLEMRAKFGDFHTYAIPGFGSGTHGTIYYVSDPREYVKVIRSEGTYPSGLIQNLWPMARFNILRKKAIAQGDDHGFFGRGQEWKDIRQFMQADLLAPNAALSYVPGIVQAAELASQAAPYCSHEVNNFLNRCSFDLFSTVMFGELIQSADPRTNATKDPLNLEFATCAASFLELNAKLILSEYETFMGRVLGIQTSQFKQFDEVFQRIWEIAELKIMNFIDRYDRGELNEFEQQSYLARSIQRQREQSGDRIISKELMIEICVALLAASVDTTSGLTAWALLHIALNPEAQEKLHIELTNNLTETGRLSADVITKRSSTPYLNAVLRESHRLTPSTPSAIAKKITSDVNIHGETIPVGSTILFNNYAVSMDPIYIDNPTEFRPERWLQDAVDSRKGTPLELIDHPYLKDPFSQGARKCPGSRVAMNEILSILAQLVLDYNISAPENVKSFTDVPQRMFGAITPIFPQLHFEPRQ